MNPAIRSTIDNRYLHHQDLTESSEKHLGKLNGFLNDFEQNPDKGGTYFRKYLGAILTQKLFLIMELIGLIIRQLDKFNKKINVVEYIEEETEGDYRLMSWFLNVYALNIRYRQERSIECLDDFRLKFEKYLPNIKKLKGSCNPEELKTLFIFILNVRDFFIERMKPQNFKDLLNFLIKNLNFLNKGEDVLNTSNTDLLNFLIIPAQDIMKTVKRRIMNFGIVFQDDAKIRVPRARRGDNRRQKLRKHLKMHIEKDKERYREEVLRYLEILKIALERDVPGIHRIVENSEFVQIVLRLIEEFNLPKNLLPIKRKFQKTGID